MELKHEYRTGDQVRLTCPYAGGFVGEEAKVLCVQRNSHGDVLAIDVLLGELGERSYISTVHPEQVEPVHPQERAVGRS